MVKIEFREITEETFVEMMVAMKAAGIAGFDSAGWQQCSDANYRAVMKREIPDLPTGSRELLSRADVDDLHE